MGTTDRKEVRTKAGGIKPKNYLISHHGLPHTTYPTKWDYSYLHGVEDYSYTHSNGEAYQVIEDLNSHTLINMYGKDDGKNVYYQEGFVDPNKIYWIDNDTLEIDV